MIWLVFIYSYLVYTQMKLQMTCHWIRGETAYNCFSSNRPFQFLQILSSWQVMQGLQLRSCKHRLTTSDFTVHVLIQSRIHAWIKYNCFKEKKCLIAPSCDYMFFFCPSKSETLSVFLCVFYCLPGKGASKTRNIFVSDEIPVDINRWHLSSLLGGK